MKNLLIFVNPARKFIEDYENLAKTQIANSLDLGWRKEDIILATNFSYEYMGVKSTVVDDSCYYGKRRRASKQTTICHLMDRRLITDKCWVHDCDAYQLLPFENGEPDLKGKDMGFTSNILSPYLTDWNGGSFFFLPSAKDVFNLIREDMYRHGYHDEQSITVMSANNYNNINSRYTILNNTYNYCRVRDTVDHYATADKPIKVLHFNPRDKEVYEELKPLMSDALIQIFKNHGYE